MEIFMAILMEILWEFLMIDSMGFNDCLLFIQEFGTDCFCLVVELELTIEAAIKAEEFIQTELIFQKQVLLTLGLLICKVKQALLSI